VVAERGPIRFSRAPAAISRDDDGNGLEEDEDPKSRPKPKPKPKGKPKADSPPKSGKKYVNIKLIDFGERARCASSATGGKAVIRGDAFLSLLLFESDGFDLTTKDGGGRPQKVYKGGSRGAFEELSKLKEGDVVALLNPKVLKPFQVSPFGFCGVPPINLPRCFKGPSDSPHPVNNILAITPDSAGSIIVIGRARDLGMCTATKRDGKLCGSWCDKRVSDVCEWHVQNAVESRRAARPEFSIG
jgi:minichromosome maintenance protein 10